MSRVDLEMFRTIQRKTRQIKRKIFFIVEGEKTETDYCKELLNTRYCKLQSEIVLVSENNVSKIKEILIERNYEKGSDICYVFQDLDRYSKKHYLKDKNEHLTLCQRYEALRNEYQFIFTQPSFEYNIYLHLAKRQDQKNKLFKTKEEIIKEIEGIMKPKNPIGTKCKDFYRLSGCTKENLDQKNAFFEEKASNVRDVSINQMKTFQIKANGTIESYLNVPNFSMIGLMFQTLDSILDARNDEKYVNRHV
ncbi:MAG: RloB domain-containing protein [Culicoidibacterales bacterium]